MEQMLARLTPYGKSPGLIRSRAEPALHPGANHDVFLLHHFAYSHALANVSHIRLARVSEIKIEDHLATTHAQRQHQIRVQVSFVPIQHEVRVLPEIICA